MKCTTHYFGMCVQNEEHAREMILATGYGFALFVGILILSYVASRMWPN